jgi:plasmid stabilization system protein ParE
MAALPVELHPEALAEAREARLWYAQRDPSAAERFMAELDRAIERVALSPTRWPAHLHGTRRYLMRRFPYLLVYRVKGDAIEVLACQHGRRRPGYWRDRLAGSP